MNMEQYFSIVSREMYAHKWKSIAMLLVWLKRTNIPYYQVLMNEEEKNV